MNSHMLFTAEARRVRPEEAHAFFLLHGMADVETRSSTLDLGLFRGEGLVAVAQWGRPYDEVLNRLYSTQLLRVASVVDADVSAALHSLLEHYQRKYGGDFVVSERVAAGEEEILKKSGLHLVEASRSYLVRPGLSLAATDRKDRLPLPEKGLDEKIAREIDLLEWREEVLAAGEFWEWRGPLRTYYTYKITANDSHKYYYGVKSAAKAGASKEDCLTDGYWGSGGEKFQRWREKHRKGLKKEVISLHYSMTEAWETEAFLVGDKYKIDPASLNSIPGGTGAYRPPLLVQISHCAKHGEVKHLGEACLTCRAKASIGWKTCPVHGRSKHQGPTCRKCLNASIITVQYCEIHGQTRFIGSTCFSCRRVDASVESCPIHGHATFKTGKCWRCTVNESFRIDECEVHGEVLFRGGACASCSKAKGIGMKDCPTHGLTKHDGDHCAQCRSEALVSLKECPTHGRTKFQGSTCSKCSSEKTLSERTCPIHGLGLHSGESCRKCISDRAITMGECSKHGKTKHNGTRCARCHAESAYGMKVCSTHGETKHRGQACLACENEKKFQYRDCAVHGRVKHRGRSCPRCVADSKKTVEDCPKHGTQVFYNSTCPKCKGEKIRHTKGHAVMKDPECDYCR